MTFQGWLLIAAFLGILLLLCKPMGQWLFALYEGRRTPLHAVLGPVETGFYRLSGIDPTEEQGWRRYAKAEEPVWSPCVGIRVYNDRA